MESTKAYTLALYIMPCMLTLGSDTTSIGTKGDLPHLKVSPGPRGDVLASSSLAMGRRV